MKIAWLLGLILLPAAASAEVKFLSGNKVVAFNTAAAVDVYLSTSKSDLKNLCKGYLQASAAFPDLEKQTVFPLRNNVYPASDFVAGFLEMAHWGRNLGYGPIAFQLIMANLTADKDKAFSKQERDNVVALWTDTMSWNPLNCGAK